MRGTSASKETSIAHNSWIDRLKNSNYLQYLIDERAKWEQNLRDTNPAYSHYGVIKAEINRITQEIQVELHATNPDSENPRRAKKEPVVRKPKGVHKRRSEV